jgi:hypothetical protein
MEIRDISYNLIKKIPKKVGTIFFINGRPFRRGVGILYSARRGTDPTLCRGFWKREKRRRGGSL